MVIVSVLSMVFGLSGCSGNEKYTVDEIVSFHTSDYGTERFPVYSFALQKEDDNWFFSASCYVGSQKEHYTSFVLSASRRKMQKDFLKSSARMVR